MLLAKNEVFQYLRSLLSQCCEPLVYRRIGEGLYRHALRNHVHMSDSVFSVAVKKTTGTITSWERNLLGRVLY